jgi:hypothetical protein
MVVLLLLLLLWRCLRGVLSGIVVVLVAAR